MNFDFGNYPNQTTFINFGTEYCVYNRIVFGGGLGPMYNGVIDLGWRNKVIDLREG